MELAPGVVTPGWFDTRAVARRIPLPHDLSGQRCLDVGTFDGYWAFEMERRGASDVHAIDILDPLQWDWPADARPEDIGAISARKGSGQGFEIARDALGSTVVRHERSIYDVTESELGQFDFVFVGSLLLHLRDPIGALSQLRSVCRGRILIVDAVNPFLSVLSPKRPVSTLDGRGRPWWWRPNVAGLVRMAEAAGFTKIGQANMFAMPAGPGQSRPSFHLRMLRHPSALSEGLRARVGDPHAAVMAMVKDSGASVG